MRSFTFNYTDAACILMILASCVGTLWAAITYWPVTLVILALVIVANIVDTYKHKIPK